MKNKTYFRRGLTAILFSLTMLNGCKKEHDSKTCWVTQVGQNQFDHYDYEYSQGRLSKLTFFNGKPIRRIELAYDSKGQLVTAVDNTLSGTDGAVISYINISFAYGPNGKPSNMSEYLLTDAYPFLSTDFTYDANGLLETKQSGPTKTRFEYDTQGNVIKIYYTSYMYGQEVLGRTNTSFDDRTPFYANSPGLDILEVYYFDYIPTRHNILHSDVDMPNPNWTFTTTLHLDFTVAYNANGLVTTNTGGIGLVPDFAFLSATYDCK